MMRRRHDFLVVGATWVVLTIVGLVWVTTTELNPIKASREAEIIDAGFDFLMLLSVPVFMFVVVVLVYAGFRFRAQDINTDGAGFRTNKRFITIWVVVSSILAVLVIIHPGLTGLAELQAEPHADFTVEVTARQWAWTFDYTEQGVLLEEADELVLPVNRRVRFLVTSEDVIHSFWIPGFRTKIDAVPGLTTEILTTPVMEGTFRQDPNFRVQCAELCGTGHTRMRTDVVVMSEADFDSWIEGRRG